MGLRYHVFFVDNKLPFNVGCAKEALFLISTEFAKNKVRYETIDPLALAPVVVMFDQGLVESIVPPEAKLVEGGVCGHNNLFVSQQNSENWTKMQPRLAQQQTPPVYDIRERLAQITEQVRQQSSSEMTTLTNRQVPQSAKTELVSNLMKHDLEFDNLRPKLLSIKFHSTQHAPADKANN
jgi:hypothetical protein